VDATTVVWVAPAGNERPALADHALDEWGRSRGIELVQPTRERTARLHVDESLADSVEDELEKARDASSALDVDGAERSLARAEAILREHPELPQGAWLMAEVERGWARRWASVPPKELDRASRAWARARGLDGGREPGLGEVASPEAEENVSFHLSLDGEGEVLLDGRPVALGDVKSTPGEHQLTITRKGTLVWAGWIGVGEGSIVRVAPPDPPSCSAEDFSRVLTDGPRVRSEGVTCDRWVAVVPAAKGTLLIATCRRDRCGAFSEWRANDAVPHVPAVGEPAHWPAWATWTFVGVGVAAIAGATIGIDAAFHSSASPPAFTVGNVRGGR
jgi:hypothetical protein